MNILKHPVVFGIFVMLVLGWGTVMNSRAQQLIQLRQLPAHGSFYSLQGISDHGNYPPLPFDPYPRLPLYEVSPGEYIFNDQSVDYQVSQTPSSRSGMMMEEDDSGPSGPPGGGGTGEGLPSGGGSSLLGINTNELYLTIALDGSGNADITATNILANFYCQLLSTTNLSLVETNVANHLQNWQLGQVIGTVAPANQVTFGSIALSGAPNLFFWAQQAFVNIQIAMYDPDSAQWGSCSSTNSLHDNQIDIGIPDAEGDNSPTNDLTIYCQIGGSAINGIDYSYLPGSVVLSNGLADVFLDLYPTWQCTNSPFTLDSTVTLTLLQNSNYVIESGSTSIFLTILNTNLADVFKFVTNLDHPDGLEYSPYLTNLIASESGYFVQVGTNTADHLVVTQFSGVSGVSDEMELAVVKGTTNGFTNGWVYFGYNNGIGSDGAVGRIAPDGSSFTNGWAVLTNAGANHTLLCFDQTGIFSNDLVVVAGFTTINYTNTVWLIDSTGNARLLASVPANGFEWEGVITLPDNTNQYGYLAGQIVAGVEGNEQLCTVDTNGNAAFYATTNWVANGIQVEHLDLIPTNVASQNLYWADETGKLFKLSGTLFTNNIGDLLITQGGEFQPENNPPALYVAHWNSAIQDFDLKFVPMSSTYYGDEFEDVIFAPINLPAN